MLPRVLEVEVMDSSEEARDYDAMDHSQVNRVFVTDFLAFCPNPENILDVGTGTAQIPIELCRQHPTARVVGIDLAEHMLSAGRKNVNNAGLGKRIELRRIDAKGLPFEANSFHAVMSNSIVHHIPEPKFALSEMIRVARSGGAVFVRDLLRPNDDATVRRLVELYAKDTNAHQRQLFEDSLRAALTLDETLGLISELGHDPAAVQQTSDRHWTWTARKL
jgi:ubiquinone/menaquinone biosynthesis C-methylase UbiE